MVDFLFCLFLCNHLFFFFETISLIMYLLYEDQFERRLCYCLLVDVLSPSVAKKFFLCGKVISRLFCSFVSGPRRDIDYYSENCVFLLLNSLTIMNY